MNMNLAFSIIICPLAWLTYQFYSRKKLEKDFCLSNDLYSSALNSLHKGYDELNSKPFLDDKQNKALDRIVGWTEDVKLRRIVELKENIVSLSEYKNKVASVYQGDCSFSEKRAIVYTWIDYLCVLLSEGDYWTYPKEVRKGEIYNDYCQEMEHKFKLERLLNSV